MTLYFIGLGLGNEQDISLKALEIIKSCNSVYLESYTSKLSCSKEDLEKLYGKEIIIADRTLVEQKAESTILKDAQESNTAFLVIGDPFSATTHTDLFLRVKQVGIKTEIIHNTSILNAIGETGLELYKFGKTTSIPFQKDVRSPIDIYSQNQNMNAHTLFLLDLDPINNKFLTINEAAEYLSKHIKKTTKAVAIQALTTKDQKIVYATLASLQQAEFTVPPYCIIIPSKHLHFAEEEALEQWKSE